MPKPKLSEAYRKICAWGNLLVAFQKAARRKRGTPNVAKFEYQVADRLLNLQTSLLNRSYRPGAYQNFYIHEPKRRKISAAPFADRIVHHALCNIIEPRFERCFLPDSFANRSGRGTHRAVDRLQYFTQHYRYALRIDIVKHFPSVDHEILHRLLQRRITEQDVMDLADVIIASGAGIFENEVEYRGFPGDDRDAPNRPRGLPIGNLTSQFWSNCYLDPFDHFVKRELGCKAYLRYVDDCVFFSHYKSQLWHWKRAIIERLAGLRLRIHQRAAQVVPVESGIPWLGFVVFPSHRRIKARKVRYATANLRKRYDDYRSGKTSFAELDASVQGWINHVRYGDTWGLRRHVLNDIARSS